MIHIPALIIGAAIWYYDPHLRKLVKKHVTPKVNKLEEKAVKIYESVRRQRVNKKTNDQ